MKKIIITMTGEKAGENLVEIFNINLTGEDDAVANKVNFISNICSEIISAIDLDIEETKPNMYEEISKHAEFLELTDESLKVVEAISNKMSEDIKKIAIKFNILKEDTSSEDTKGA